MIAEFESGHTLFDDEGTDASGSDSRRGEGEDYVDVGLSAVGDEDLLTVEQVIVALQYSGGLRAAGIRTGIRLGKAEGAELLALRERNKIFLLLLLGSVRGDGPGSERSVRGEDNAHAGVDSGELLHGDGVACHVKPCAAVFLRVGKSHDAEIGHLANNL